MCGLVGVLGDVSFQVRGQVFKDFLDVCQVRGRDSTGVIKVEKDFDYAWVKQVGPPSFLYQSATYESVIEKSATPLALIGHCRAKTVGEASSKNAHPFDFPEKGICGVHNGTLRNYYGLDTYHHTKVDSEVLYGHLANNGPEDTFSKVEGAFACVWYDANEQMVNFIRNNERPLWFARSKDLKMLFWASEKWMFGAVQRKVDLFAGDDELPMFFELPLNTLWQVKINPENFNTKDRPVMTFRAPKEIPPFRPKATTTYNGLLRGGNTNGAWTRDDKGSLVRKASVEVVPTGGSVVRPFPERKETTEETPLLLTADMKLDDSLTGVFPNNTKEEATSTQTSNVVSLNTSSHSTDTSKDSKTTKQSRRPILSLPVTNLKISKQKSNGTGSPVQSNACGGFLHSPVTQPLPSRLLIPTRSSALVDFRTVAGVRYITDCRTGREISFDEVVIDTGGTCYTCKGTLDTPYRIAEFIDRHAVICRTCAGHDINLKAVNVSVN